jgi:hypothetical protein
MIGHRTDEQIARVLVLRPSRRTEPTGRRAPMHVATEREAPHGTVVDLAAVRRRARLGRTQNGGGDAA